MAPSRRPKQSIDEFNASEASQKATKAELIALRAWRRRLPTACPDIWRCFQHAERR